MLKALAWKEMRELLPLAVLALVVQIYFVTRATGTQWGSINQWIDAPMARSSFTSNAIPFIDLQYRSQPSAAKYLCLIGAVAAMGFGLWQTMWEGNNGTYRFLLHRPLDRRAIIGVKLVLGLVIGLLITALPLLYYTFWAATPGTHASPFFWAFTTSAWLLCVETPLVYLGAFLSGLRPGRWLGSRFLPLLAALGALYALRSLPMATPNVASWEWIALTVVLLLDVLFVVAILFVTRARDFS